MSSFDNDIKRALYTRLAGDATLNSMLSAGSAIYDKRAPQNAGTAVVIYQKQSGVPSYVMGGGTAWEDQRYLVKAVTSGGQSSAPAGRIDARIDALLNGLPLTVSGRNQFCLKRVGDIDFVENASSTDYFHQGGSYRLMTS